MKKIGFIGAGNMASALIKGIVKSKMYESYEIMASDPNKEKLENLHKNYGISLAESNEELIHECEIIILAIKPQILTEVLKRLTIKETRLFISILAGVSISKLERLLPEKAEVIRVMPNTPALVQRGVTAICTGTSTTSEHLEVAKKIFESVGVVKIVDEKYIEAISAISGSGPAYFFYVIDAIADAGLKVGLPKDLSIFLAAQTALGSAQMLLETKLPPSVLKDNVTSPGGTTIDALTVLEEYGLRAAFIKAIEAAVSKSEKLGE